MKIRLYITIILMALLISGVVPIVLAQDIAAGLSPGYQFTYSVTGSYFTVDASVEIPEEVINAQQSVYFKVMIDNVTGPDIGYSWLWHFANGTDKNGTGTLNLETTTNTGPFWAIVPANLKAGERIHPNFGPDLTVSTRPLCGLIQTALETNYLELQIAYQNEAAQAFKNVTSESYFDKQTGMLIQLSEKTVYQNPAFTTIITWKLQTKMSGLLRALVHIKLSRFLHYQLLFQ